MHLCNLFTLFYQRFYQHGLKKIKRQGYWLILLGIIGLGIGLELNLLTRSVNAQDSLQQQENQVIQQYSLPSRTVPAPVYQPRPSQTRRSAPASRPAPRPAPRSTPSPAPSASTPSADTDAPDKTTESTAKDTTTPAPKPAPPPEPVVSQYVMEFNRSPVVGNRLRLQGVYSEARLGITRPQDWDIKTMNVLLRFQHSPSLVPERSNLTLRVNDTSVGSVWLDQPNSKISEAVFEIPPNLIQDYNELAVVVEQHTSEICTHPDDPTLWTEVLPDSKVVMDYTPKATTLDFSRYPFPFIDPLNVDINHLVYLSPKTYTDSWLTAAGQLQASLARLAGPRSLDTRLVESSNELEWGDRLIVIGQPSNQPILSKLTLPFDIKENRILDGSGEPLSQEDGILVLSTLEDGAVPVLVVTGNSDEAVEKAVQSLVQPQDRSVEAGQALVVSRVSSVATPKPREWPEFLPTARDTFQLAQLKDLNGDLFTDITVSGTSAPTIQIPFRALPDEVFHRGSTMTLHYNYSAQVSGRTSSVNVLLDNIAITSKQLDSWGRGRKRFKLDLPPQLIKPDSVLGVQFVLKPRDSRVCGPDVNQQLTGTLYSTTLFNLKRDISVSLPDLGLLKSGFPFAAPQDLSDMAIVLPDNPSPVEVETLLAVSKRLGSLSQAESIQFEVYRIGSLSNTIRRQKHLVAIGLRDRFPLPSVLNGDGGGFGLRSGFTRLWKGGQIQSFPNKGGVIKSVLSDRGEDRIILALTAQSDTGLEDVRDTFDRGPLFNQLRGDTVLVNRNQANPSPYSGNGYTVKALQQSPQRQIQQASSLSAVSFFLQQYWFLIPTVLILLALLLYGISQLYLDRISDA